MREKLAELSPLMLASFLVQASNAAITTMIAIIIAQQPGGNFRVCKRLTKSISDAQGAPVAQW